MKAIPLELTCIIDRLQQLNNIKNVNEIFSFDYDRACEDFEAVSLNQQYAQQAKFYAEKAYNLLTDIRARVYSVFDDVKSYQIVKEEVYNKEGEQISIPTLDEISVDDEMRKAWYANFAVELKAYEIVLERILKLYSDKKLLSEGEAKYICNIEIGKGRLISSDEDSVNGFIDFLTKELTASERDKIKIKIGCSRQLSAYAFSFLYKENIIPFSIDEIADSGCFYNKSGKNKLTKDSYRADLSKYKPENETENETADLFSFLELFRGFKKKEMQ